MHKKESSNYLWYIRSKNEVKGPFTIGMVQRFVLIGRLKMDTEVSQDKKHWTKVKDTPMVIPEEMHHVHSDEDQQRLLQARLREDERLKERRKAEQQAEFEGVRSGNDRRKAEDINMRVHRELKLQGQEQYITTHKNTLPVLVAGLFLLVLMAVGVYVYFESAKIASSTPDCNALPGPTINWSHCQMQGVQLDGKDLSAVKFNNTNLNAANLSATKLDAADLAYADLSLAQLEQASLKQASLKGANLRNADLSRTDFTAADLSHADLRNANISEAIFKDAILHKTIWVDGRLCLPGSLGQCRTE